jgi:hypothetical protein
MKSFMKFLLFFSITLLSHNLKGQEYTTLTRDVHVIDAKTNFAQKAGNIKIAEITYKHETNIPSSDTIPDEIVNKPPIEYTKIEFQPEELETAFPHAVHIDASGNKNVDYSSLIPIMFRIIQEQEKRIKQLELKNQ